MQAQVLTPWLSEDSRNEMLVALEYPAAWTDITWQADAFIGTGKLDRFVALGESLSVEQIMELQADDRFVVLWSGNEGEEVPDPDDLLPEQVETLVTELSAVLSSDVAKLVTLDKVAPKQIAAAVIEATQYAPWVLGETVTPGDVRYFEGNLFECVQGHTPVDPGWTPPATPALWKRFYEPSDDPWPWVQPQGAHDAYPDGARVLHNGGVWVNEIAANVWEPGVTGWTLESGGEPTEAWTVGVAYTVGDLVTYNGTTYRCLQSHTSQAGWTPPVVPALWAVVA